MRFLHTATPKQMNISLVRMEETLRMLVGKSIASSPKSEGYSNLDKVVLITFHSGIIIPLTIILKNSNLKILRIISPIVLSKEALDIKTILEVNQISMTYR